MLSECRLHSPRTSGNIAVKRGDVSVREGTLRVHMNGELKVEDDVSKFAASNAYFKTGTYHRGIEPQAVEFESLSITAK